MERQARCRGELSGDVRELDLRRLREGLWMVRLGSSMWHEKDEPAAAAGGSGAEEGTRGHGDAGELGFGVGLGGEVSVGAQRHRGAWVGSGPGGEERAVSASSRIEEAEIQTRGGLGGGGVLAATAVNSG